MDVWERDGKKYIRIVDYKTGDKVDWTDVQNGLSVQLRSTFSLLPTL